MTFREFMQENGYDLITTFWEDFSIADKYGIAGVKDTYKRAFSEWKDDLLVRKEGNKKWNISLFAREIVDDYNGLPYKYECSNGTLWDYCIPFEGNGCLLETAENPEK